ncbi:hypothetical protein ASPFODRAFT_52139 [Aspergillus luchuensis CBS 106.47]|uniref:Uncharacterized protein n=1 Tax=Aspergillus luchuensis (strain CBS 106.47) TaxID=1137211 RepID=A0A1M3T311_ASPLC|nr:hypothetical protein ASPFODRAFT_52139 [Aspergillus luchuensis CBS 106.47]
MPLSAIWTRRAANDAASSIYENLKSPWFPRSPSRARGEDRPTLLQDMISRRSI